MVLRRTKLSNIFTCFTNRRIPVCYVLCIPLTFKTRRKFTNPITFASSVTCVTTMTTHMFILTKGRLFWGKITTFGRLCHQGSEWFKARAGTTCFVIKVAIDSKFGISLTLISLYFSSYNTGVMTILMEGNGLSNREFDSLDYWRNYSIPSYYNTNDFL